MSKRHVIALIVPLFLALTGLAQADDPPTGAPPAQATATTPATSTNPVVSRIVTMTLARVGAEQFDAAEAEGEIVRTAQIYVGSYGDVEHKQLHYNSAAIADSYIEYVIYKVQNSTTWPADHTQQSATDELATLKTEAAKPDIDLLPILRRANEVLAWSMGKSTMTPDVDHFAKHDELVTKVLATVPGADKLSDTAGGAATQPVPGPQASTSTPATDALSTPPATTTPPAGTTAPSDTTAPTGQTDASAGTATGAEDLSPLATITSKVATIYLVRLAIGEVPATRVAEGVVTDVKAITADFSDAQKTKLNDDLKASANKYLDFVTERAKASTTWPSDRPANTYIGMAALSLSMIRDEVAAAEPDSDLVGPLSRANRVLAWSNGLAEPSAELDHFAKHATVVEYALGRASAIEQPKRPAETAPAQAPTPQ